MKMEHDCPVCQAIRNETIDKLPIGHGYVVPRTEATDYIRSVHITTDPVAQATCANGHLSRVDILDGGYALLFERALQRLATGEPRDAVIDAYTAFEIFISHVPVRARYDREQGASPRALRKELRQATETGERSLASALATASVVSGRAPPKVDPKKTTRVRNAAVHAGKYPAIDAAERVALEIEATIREFESQLGTQVGVNEIPYGVAAALEEIADAVERRKIADLPHVRVHLATVLDMTHTKPLVGFKLSAAERLQHYRERPGWWRVW